MTSTFKTTCGGLLTALALTLLCCPAGAQTNDDPFAAVDDDPFAAGSTAPFGSNAADPFTATDGGAAGGESPFGPAETTPAAGSSPFDLEAPPTASSPFQTTPGQFQETDVQSGSPFGEDGQVTRPGRGRLLGPGRLPMRLELTLEDPAVRRAAEIRGVYVSATNRGFQSTSQVEALLADVAAGDFSRVYAEVRVVGSMAYRSELEPSLPFVNMAFPNPIAEVRAGLGDERSLIAVTETLPVHNAIVGSRPPANSTAARFPNFVMTDPMGNLVAPDNLIYLDPGDPAVRDFLALLYFEMATNTRANGFLLTGLRYPSTDFGYNPAAVKAFRDLVGGEGPPLPDDKIWNAWRRNQLTEVILVIREAIALANPTAKVAVQIEVDGPPPASFAEYLQSPTYSTHMQDWVTWCRIEAIDEIVFQVHERLAPQDNHLRPWVQFINSNVGTVRPAISLAGRLNTRQGLMSQFTFARERAIGTILYDYADPARDFSRGFYPSMRDTLLRGAPGRPVMGRELEWQPEDRVFVKLAAPPASLALATPTPAADRNPLAGRTLVFATPSPIPTPTPPPARVPANIEREITLRNGRVMRAVVVEVVGSTITIKPEDGPQVQIPRPAVVSIEPPL